MWARVSVCVEDLRLRLCGDDTSQVKASKEKYSDPVITLRVQYGQQHKKNKNKVTVVSDSRHVYSNNTVCVIILQHIPQPKCKYIKENKNKKKKPKMIVTQSRDLIKTLDALTHPS